MRVRDKQMKPSTTRFRVFIIEDQPEFRNRLKLWIQESENFEFAGEAGGIRAGFKGILNSDADLLILDMGLPDGSGSDLIAPVLSCRPKIKIAAYTVFEDEKLLIKCIRNGAKGYILKDTEKDLFLSELRVIALGGASLTMRMADRILKDISNAPEILTSPLTEREKEILNYMSLGYTSKSTADELNISGHTVRRHIENIYRKLEVSNKAEALRAARLFGLLE